MLTVINQETSQVCYLSKLAGEVIKNAQYTNIDELITHTKSVFDCSEECENKIREDLVKLVYQLEGLGIVEILKQETNSNMSGLFVAGEVDYANIADFIENNQSNPLNYIQQDTLAGYFHKSAIRVRQFNNREINILYYEHGEQLCDFVIGIPPVGSSVLVLPINTIVFNKNIDLNKAEEILEKALEFVQKELSSEYNKIRFTSYSTNHDNYAKILGKLGFNFIACFKNEVNKNIDLSIFDKQIGA